MTDLHPAGTATVRPRPDGVPAELGRPRVPGSKSHAQRALLLAGVGHGDTRLTEVPDGRDVAVMARAVAALGAGLERDGSTWLVRAAETLRPAAIDCEDDGTALRTLLLTVPLVGSRAQFSASPRLRQRPHGDALAALAELGAGHDRGTDPGHGAELVWPLAVDGTHLGAPRELAFAVGARWTSQAASGAVLGLACRALRGLGGGTAHVVYAPGVPRGYVEMSCAVARAFGVAVAARTGAVGAGEPWSIGVGSARPAAVVYAIPPDASSATFVAALAVLHGLPMPAGGRDGHPDWEARTDLAHLAAAGPTEPVRLEGLGQRPDSFPALCAVAAAREARTTLVGAAALRHKESDRIATMAAGLRALGVVCEELPDGLVVHGRGQLRSAHAAPVLLPPVDDHRVVMALALLGTVLPGGVTVGPVAAVEKSWPGFFTWLASVADVA